MKSIYFVLLPNDICCSLQSFAAIALKTKSYDENFVTAECACINDGGDVFDAIKRYSVSITILHVLQRLNKHFVIIIINVAWVARWTYKEEN